MKDMPVSPSQLKKFAYLQFSNLWCIATNYSNLTSHTIKKLKKGYIFLITVNMLNNFANTDSLILIF